jgi:hypothetical protein
MNLFEMVRIYGHASWALSRRRTNDNSDYYRCEASFDSKKSDSVIRRFPFNARRGISEQESQIPDDMAKLWFELVWDFTKRNLTDQSEMLVATSGLARAVSTTRQGRYLAGIWESHLPAALLWKAGWDEVSGFRIRESLVALPKSC